MLTDKQMTIEALDHLPETVSFQEIKDELAVISGLKMGLEASEACEFKTSAELKEIVNSWTTK